LQNDCKKKGYEKSNDVSGSAIPCKKKGYEKTSDVPEFAVLSGYKTTFSHVNGM
jgi:hypothetical protein